MKYLVVIICSLWGIAEDANHRRTALSIRGLISVNEMSWKEICQGFKDG